MRSFYIRRSDIAHHGYATGCKGCTALRLHKPPRGHPDERRSHILEQLRQQPASKRCIEQAEEARDAKLARYIERQDQAQAGGRPQAPEGPVSGGTAQSGAPESSGAGEVNQGRNSIQAAGSSNDPPSAAPRPPGNTANQAAGSSSGPPSAASRQTGNAAGSSTDPPGGASGQASATGASTSGAGGHASGGQEVRAADEAFPAGHDAPHTKRVRRGDEAEMSELIEYGLDDIKATATTRVHVVKEQDTVQEISRIEEGCCTRDRSGRHFVMIRVGRASIVRTGLL